MKPFAYLRRHREGSRVSFLLGGVVELLVLAIIGIFGVSVVDQYLLGSPSLASVVSAVLVDLANGDRAANDVGLLTLNPTLTKAAQAKADDMAAKGYFAHVSPDGRNSWTWFKDAGYRFIYAGENLAVDFSDSEDVERAWMNSPTHRRNILDGHFTEVGIATARGTYKGRATIFVVQMFGAPAAVASEAPVRTLASPVSALEPALATTKPATNTPARIAGAATTSALEAAAPARVLGTSAEGLVAPVQEASWWQHLIASPKTLLRYGYYLLGLVIFLMLAYATEAEFKKHHLRHVAAAVLLLALMAIIFLLAEAVFFTEPIIAALQI